MQPWEVLTGIPSIFFKNLNQKCKKETLSCGKVFQKLAFLLGRKDYYIHEASFSEKGGGYCMRKAAMQHRNCLFESVKDLQNNLLITILYSVTILYIQSAVLALMPCFSLNNFKKNHSKIIKTLNS